MLSCLWRCYGSHSMLWPAVSGAIEFYTYFLAPFLILSLDMQRTRIYFLFPAKSYSWHLACRCSQPFLGPPMDYPPLGWLAFVRGLLPDHGGSTFRPWVAFTCCHGPPLLWLFRSLNPSGAFSRALFLLCSFHTVENSWNSTHLLVISHTSKLTSKEGSLCVLLQK